VTRDLASAHRQASGARTGPLALVVGVGLLVWALPLPAGVEPRAWRLLAIFVATVVGIIVRPLPMGAMSIVGIAVAPKTPKPHKESNNKISR
jgi:di/tricarboxylate transporter